MLTILCLFLCIVFLLQINFVSIGIHHYFKKCFEIELLFKGYFIGFFDIIGIFRILSMEFYVTGLAVLFMEDSSKLPPLMDFSIKVYICSFDVSR